MTQSGIIRQCTNPDQIQIMREKTLIQVLQQRALLYDQISASGFSTHDLHFLNYNSSVTCAAGRCRTFRDFKNIDYVTLNVELDNICWDQVYTLGYANDRLAYIQEKMCQPYDRCVSVKTKLVKTKLIKPK